MWKWVLGAALLTTACVGAALTRKRAFAEEPHDVTGAARLQKHARVIFITLDGPLRDDVLSGPHMRGLQEAVRKGGLAFAAEATSSMALSLPGYQAMSAGTQTSCLDNDCGRITVETVGELLARRLSLPPQDVAVFASWSRLAHAASSRDGAITVDAPEDGPKRDGGPPWRNARFDDETFARARAHWEKHHPRFLHIALLDTDEWAHVDNHEKYEQALRDTDARIVEVLRWVAALPAEEQAVTTVLLASDHGRSHSDWTKHGFLAPGSSEIFVAAIGPLVKRGEAGSVDHRDLRPTVERLFGLCPARVESDGRAIEAIVGELPCR
jgi:hypothetical protein